jgi:transposase
MEEDRIELMGVGRGGRMTVKRKEEAVLRLLRGDDLELVSRSLGVTAATLSKWREAFLSGGEGALKERPGDDGDQQIKRLEAKLGQVTMDNELLREKIERIEAGRPLPARRSRR